MKQYVSVSTLTVGVLTLAASVLIGYFVVPYKVRESVIQKSRIEDGNERFQKWETIPIPLFQKLFVFNVTNGEEVMKGSKPILQEVGPYVYQQKRKKFDIVFNTENETIFYKERTHYFFRPDLSNGSETDTITFVNLPFVIAALKGLSMGPSVSYLISEVLKKYSEQMYVNLTVNELFFGGRYMPYVKELSEFRGEDILPNNTFGLFYGRNGSDAGRFEIYSGVQDTEKFGQVVSWNGKTKMDWWDDEYCNRINGSDGGVFHPFVTKERVFYMFIPGLCKSFRFTFESEGNYVKGVPVLKYSIDSTFLQSPRTNPDNACYCVNPGEDLENCPEDGVFFLSGCGKEGMVLSQPHFYQGSQSFINQSIGLQPSKELHEMALNVEPYTAAPARISMRFQMNVQIKRNKYYKSLKKAPNMIHPLFWVDQTVELPDDAAAMMREKLYGTINIVNTITQGGVIIGCALIIFSPLLFFYCSRKNNEDKIEGVSYHAQGTLNGKIIFPKSNRNDTSSKPNGFLQIEKLESVQEKNPLLKQNGFLSDDKSSTINEDRSKQENAINSSSENVLQHHIPEIQGYLENPPDSRLMSFPSSNDYCNTLAAEENNTHRQLIDAVSSYENLGD